MTDTLLRVEALRTGFATAGGLLRAVDGVDLELPAGRTLGIVGEKAALVKASRRSRSCGSSPPPPASKQETSFLGRDLVRLPSEKKCNRSAAATSA